MKFISLLMALAMVFVLVGCGSSGNTQQAVSQRTNGEITAAAPEEGESLLKSSRLKTTTKFNESAETQKRRQSQKTMPKLISWIQHRA